MKTKQKTAHTFDYKILAIHKLRVNVKSLAEESRIIRKETLRCGPLYRDVLTNHRRNELRQASRIAQLALAHIRGKKYREVEPTAPKLSSSQITLLGKLIYDKLKKHWSVFYTEMVGTPDSVRSWLEQANGSVA